MFSSHARRSTPEPGGRRRRPVWAALLLVGLVLASCGLPSATTPTPAPGELPAGPASLPEQCRSDGAVQTWLLLPQEPQPSDLLSAYQDGQVVEFRATVVGQDDNPALAPHRRFILREAAEDMVLLLDYQGDPPPLIRGQSYRFVAWADPMDAPDVARPTPAAGTPASARIPTARGYELQVFDDTGLLFMGRTDVEEQDDVLGVQFGSAASDCPAVPAPQNACVQSRQALPLWVRWGDDELTLYPGEDGLLSHQGATYTVALFRNRQVVYAEPPCADYHEHRRSLRVDRVDPPPVLPVLPPITATITTTLPITLSAPLTETAPSRPAP